MSKHERISSGSMSRESKTRNDRYRSSRDDSSDRDRERRRRRDRSRSDERTSRRSRSRENKNSKSNRTDNSDQTDTRVREMSISPTREEEPNYRIPTPPPAPKIGKISIGFNKPPPKPQPIKMTLSAAPAPNPVPALKPKVASVFNDASDEEPEEMPAEARMRMRNIGRETPTSAGPNSFGKTKHGFCDAKNIFQRNLKEAMEKVNPAPNPTPKFPSTIYKFQ